MSDIIGIDHIYITVSDMARAEQFYDTVMTILGFRKNTFSIRGEAHIQYFNRHFGYVIRPARSPVAHNPYAAGLHHLCFRVDTDADVQALAASLSRAGIEASTPRAFPEYAPDYFATFFQDPDGIRLEITNFRAERRERYDGRW